MLKINCGKLIRNPNNKGYQFLYAFKEHNFYSKIISVFKLVTIIKFIRYKIN